MADSQKSEQPTQRRLKKARDEGNFVSSRQFIAGTQPEPMNPTDAFRRPNFLLVAASNSVAFAKLLGEGPRLQNSFGAINLKAVVGV